MLKEISKSSSKILGFLMLAIGTVFSFMHPEQGTAVLTMAFGAATVAIGVKTTASAYTTKCNKGEQG